MFNILYGIVEGKSMSLVEKIEALRALKKNWDSYGAEAMPERTIRLALLVAEKLGEEWKVVPCADGPSIEFYRGDEEDTITVRTSHD